METRPSRRRETFTSLQLQRASDQLQEAIQSARQHRTMYDSSTHATSLSLLSDLSSDDDEEEKESEEDGQINYDGDNQENRPPGANTQSTRHARWEIEKPAPEQKLRRFMAESLGSSRASTGRRVGASLSLKDLLESPLRPLREQRNEAVLTQQLAGESESLRGKEKEVVDDSEGLPTKKKLFDDNHIEREARKALDVLQHDVEMQARANRTLQAQLKQAVHRINGVLERVVGHSMRTRLDDAKSIDAVAVEKLGDEWASALAKWKDDVDETKRMEEQRLFQMQQEMERRVHDLEQAHRRERDELKSMIDRNANEATNLADMIKMLKKVNVDEKERQSTIQQCYQLQLDRLQMENEDWRMRLQQQETTVVPDSSILGPQPHQAHVLNLITQLKQSELRELQWEMLFDEQSQAAVQAEERLNMLLEDANRLEPSNAARTQQRLTKHPTTGDQHVTHTDRRVSLAGSTTSNELHFYQQRIEFLEEQLQDVKEQIHCDHHQFLYEQQKWELEKKHMGDDVEEVHDMSLKVLKLLLIREKLLKKQETKMQKRLEKTKNAELSMRAKQDAIHECLETVLQECGVALLYVRQLALATTSPSVALPVKPIKLVRVLKRLKTLQQECAMGWNASTLSNPSPTATVSTTSDAGSLGREYPTRGQASSRSGH